jgi:hypothetical protein
MNSPFRRAAACGGPLSLRRDMLERGWGEGATEQHQQIVQTTSGQCQIVQPND